jgi:hypothetical protein
MMDAIWFLDAPSGYGPVRLDRFAPYHEDPANYGMTNVRPMAPYSYLYPFDRDALMRIAYYFDYDRADAEHHFEAAAMLERVRAWMSDHQRGSLFVLDEGEDRLVIDDRQPAGRRGLRLHGWQADAYDACDRARTRTGLARAPELAHVGADQLSAFLDACVAQRIMLRRGDRYVALAVATPARAWRDAKKPVAMEEVA